MTGGLVQRLSVTRVQVSAAGSVELGLAKLSPHSPTKEIALRCSLWVALRLCVRFFLFNLSYLSGNRASEDSKDLFRYLA